MSRIILVVEGETEQAVVREVIAPRLVVNVGVTPADTLEDGTKYWKPTNEVQVRTLATWLVGEDDHWKAKTQ